MAPRSTTLPPRRAAPRASFLGWKPSDRVREAGSIPVTLLCGFLGAGKTTLLKHVLAQRPGGRFGLVINDVGATNLDADDLRSNFPEGDDTVQLLSELTQGCICCSIGDELADALVFLLEESRPSHILVEASGVANPRNILQTFYRVNPVGHSLLDAFRIANVVSVVDSPSLLREWNAVAADRRRRTRIFLNDPRKPFLELVMEQIETCDVMVLNKLDALPRAEREDVDALVESLNPQADRLGAVRGHIDPAALLDHARFSFEKHQRGSLAARHVAPERPAADSHERGPQEHDEHHGYGLTTAVFRAREPVSPKEFFRTLRSGLPGLVRAKGFYWTEDRLDQCGILSLAGGVLRADHAGPWFIDLLNSGRVTMEEMPHRVRRAWLNPPLGDRRQELVLIGVGIDQEEVQSKLEACLSPSGIRFRTAPNHHGDSEVTDEPAGEHFNEIHQRGRPLSMWKRAIPGDIEAAIRSWLSVRDCDVDEEIKVDEQDVRGVLSARLSENGWGGHLQARGWLIDDLTDLIYRFSEVADTSAVRFRLESLRDSGCRKFHTDKLALRMLCTYTGPGTEWVSATAVHREALGCVEDSMDEANRRIVPDRTAVQQAPTGAVLVFKGDRYPGQEGLGLVHRSAPVSGADQTRLRLCIDLKDWEPGRKDPAATTQPTPISRG